MYPYLPFARFGLNSFINEDILRENNIVVLFCLPFARFGLNSFINEDILRENNIVV